MTNQFRFITNLALIGRLELMLVVVVAKQCREKIRKCERKNANNSMVRQQLDNPSIILLLLFSLDM